MTRSRTIARPAARAAAPTVSTPRGRTETVEFFGDVVQRSEDWERLRCGLVTASVASAVMAEGEGKMRTGLLYRLAGELLTNEPGETYQNAAMQRGIEMEPEARRQFEFLHGVELEPMGFVKRTISDPIYGSFSIGCSPDSVMSSARRALEIKTMAPHLLVELLESGRHPTEFRAQCQFTMWVCGYDAVDLFLFYHGFPVSPYFEIVRDEAYIRRLKDETERFVFELDGLVKRIRNRGGS